MLGSQRSAIRSNMLYCSFHALLFGRLLFGPLLVPCPHLELGFTLLIGHVIRHSHRHRNNPEIIRLSEETPLRSHAGQYTLLGKRISHRTPHQQSLRSIQPRAKLCRLPPGRRTHKQQEGQHVRVNLCPSAHTYPVKTKTTKTTKITEKQNTQKNKKSPREAAVLIARLANHRNTHIAMLALSLLDTLVQSCGYPFHLQISTKDFLNELVRRFPERPPPFPGPVMMRILDLIHGWKNGICTESRWKEDFGNIRDMHRLLTFKGYRFRELPSQPLPSPTAVCWPFSRHLARHVLLHLVTLSRT
jgi:hypothetical protein